MADLDHPAVSAEIDRFPNRYRESPRLQGLTRNILAQVVDITTALEALPEAFDLDTAAGEALTFVGRRMGFPRPHPAGRLKTFFGFPGVSPNPVAGWTIGEWKAGPLTEEGDFDDELYRRFLKALRFKIERRVKRADLLTAAREIFGPTAHLLGEQSGVVRLATGRSLAADERVRVHLVQEVLPVAPGSRLEVWEVERAFGFGAGWGGWNEGQWPMRIW